MSDGPLLPPPEASHAGFWEGARRGELRMPRCTACTRRWFPPRPLCPHCREAEWSWVPVSGRGTLWSFVIAHPPLLPWYAARAPYNVIVVALAEDPTLRLVGNLVRPLQGAGGGLEPVPAGEIEIGSPVRVVFEPLSETVHLPRWVPA